MKKHKLQSVLFSSLLIAALSVNAFSQERSIYIFVSPNTRTGLSLNEAVRKLNSREEISLILGARGLANCLDLNAEIVKTVGNWSDGNENSSLIKTNGAENSARYVSAKLGHSFKQKFVLYFQQTVIGKATMFVISLKGTNRKLSQLAGILDRNGIEYRTFVPQRFRTLIYIVDFESGLKKNVDIVVRKLKGKLSVVKGEGSFVGDNNDVNKAKIIFEDVINAFENENPNMKQRCENKKLELLS